MIWRFADHFVSLRPDSLLNVARLVTRDGQMTNCGHRHLCPASFGVRWPGTASEYRFDKVMSRFAKAVPGHRTPTDELGLFLESDRGMTDATQISDVRLEHVS